MNAMPHFARRPSLRNRQTLLESCPPSRRQLKPYAKGEATRRRPVTGRRATCEFPHVHRLRPIRTPMTPRAASIMALADSIADVGAVVIRWVETLGDMTLFALQHHLLAVHAPAAPRHAAHRALQHRRAEPAGRRAHRHVHRHGAGRAVVHAVQGVRLRDAARRADQHVDVPRAGPGAGRHDARRPRRQRDRRRARHDARHRADRRARQHGRQPRALPRRAALPRLPADDPLADDHGRSSWASSAAGFYSVHVFGIDSYHYWNNSQQFVDNWDLFYGIFKSVFFGATIAIVSCYRGFHCAPGRRGRRPGRHRRVRVCRSS